MKMKKITDIKNQRVLYIATKNRDYLRITQELRILRENGNKVTEIVSADKSYPKRLMYVFRKLMSVKMSDYDVSFVGFAPQLIMPFFNHKLGKKPLAMDFFISVYDTMCFDRKKFRPKSLAGKFCKWLDKKTLERADLAVCDTKAHGRYFCKEFGFAPEKMSVLYLEADKSIYYPRKTEKNKDFTVLYFGSILPLQGVSVILDAIDLLKDEKNLKFVIIGPLGENGRRDSKITEYYEWLSQEELAEKIAQADLCLGGHFDGSIMKAKRTIAGKTYIYKAMEKPMILGENPANHELFSEQDKDVWFVEMGNPQKLAELITDIKNKREVCDEESN